MKSMALLPALLLLNGCYMAEQWTFVRLNDANPVGSIQKLYVAPPDLRGALVEKQPLLAYRATLSEKQQASFDADLEGFKEAFHNAVADCAGRGMYGEIQMQPQPGPSTYVVTVRLESLMLGWYAGVFSGAANATYLVEIHDPGGQVIESYRNTSEFTALSSGQRVRFLGNSVAGNVSRFFHARLRGLTEDRS